MVFQYWLSLMYLYFSRNIIEIIEETYIRVPSKSSQITKIVQKIKVQFHCQFLRISPKTSDCTYVNFTVQIKLLGKLDTFSQEVMGFTNYKFCIFVLKARISFSSFQRNLIKTFQIEALIALVTKQYLLGL